MYTKTYYYYYYIVTERDFCSSEVSFIHPTKKCTLVRGRYRSTYNNKCDASTCFIWVSFRRSLFWANGCIFVNRCAVYLFYLDTNYRYRVQTKIINYNIIMYRSTHSTITMTMTMTLDKRIIPLRENRLRSFCRVFPTVFKLLSIFHIVHSIYS